MLWFTIKGDLLVIFDFSSPDFFLTAFPLPLTKSSHCFSVLLIDFLTALPLPLICPLAVWLHHCCLSHLNVPPAVWWCPSHFVPPCQVLGWLLLVKRDAVVSIDYKALTEAAHNLNLWLGPTWGGLVCPPVFHMDSAGLYWSPYGTSQWSG